MQHRRCDAGCSFRLVRSDSRPTGTNLCFCTYVNRKHYWWKRSLARTHTNTSKHIRNVHCLFSFAFLFLPLIIHFAFIFRAHIFTCRHTHTHSLTFSQIFISGREVCTRYRRDETKNKIIKDIACVFGFALFISQFPTHTHSDIQRHICIAE